MNENEIAHIGDSYKAEVTRLFSFLITEYGCGSPEEEDAQYRHVVTYACASRAMDIVFSNAFHPVDYGFEIALYSIGAPRRIAERRIVFYVLKDDQDSRLEFLKGGVPAVREALNALAGV